MSRTGGLIIGKALGPVVGSILMGALLIIAGFGMGISRLATVMSGAAVYVQDQSAWNRSTRTEVIEIGDGISIVEYTYTTEYGTTERRTGTLRGKPEIRERVGLSTPVYYEKANPSNIAREVFDFMGGIMVFVFPILFGCGFLSLGLWLRRIQNKQKIGD